MGKGLIGYIVFCFVIVVAELIFMGEKHHFSVESVPFFYGFVGFASFIVIVKVAQLLLRPLVSREEDYYD